MARDQSVKFLLDTPSPIHDAAYCAAEIFQISDLLALATPADRIVLNLAWQLELDALLQHRKTARALRRRK
jgi:hypothetical protein